MKWLVLLALLQSGAQVSDGVTTRGFVARGYVEVDPVARLVLGPRPTWKRMTPLGGAQISATTMIAEQLRVSKNRWARKLWWVPQVVSIGISTESAVHNARLR